MQHHLDLGATERNLRWEQKRWWPHGTSANRASRGAFKHTSQTVYWVNLLRLSFKTPKKSSLLSSPLCSSNVWVSWQFPHDALSQYSQKHIFEKFAFHTFQTPGFSTPAFSAPPQWVMTCYITLDTRLEIGAPKQVMKCYRDNATMTYKSAGECLIRVLQQR